MSPGAGSRVGAGPGWTGDWTVDDLSRLDVATTDELIGELLSRMENAVLVLVPPVGGDHENDHKAGVSIHTLGEEIEDLATTMGLLEVGRERMRMLVREKWRRGAG